MTIGLVGKYVQLHDAYLSVAEALRHAGYALTAPRWTSSGSTPRPLTEGRLRRRFWAQLDGIIVPGGFGERGIEGMILTAAVRPGASGYPIWASAWACRSR